MADVRSGQCGQIAFPAMHPQKLSLDTLWVRGFSRPTTSTAHVRIFS